MKKQIKIKFDEIEKQKSCWIFHYGNVKINNEEFPFTLFEMYDATSDTSGFDVTWVENQPTDYEMVNEEIIKNFKKTTNKIC